jgi:hypothetical protein
MTRNAGRQSATRWSRMGRAHMRLGVAKLVLVARGSRPARILPNAATGAACHKAMGCQLSSRAESRDLGLVPQAGHWDGGEIRGAGQVISTPALRAFAPLTWACTNRRCTRMGPASFGWLEQAGHGRLFMVRNPDWEADHEQNMDVWAGFHAGSGGWNQQFRRILGNGR